ncbi:serine/threonine-protein phosphatase 5, partial [Biomphalaria glabrata]
MDLANCEYFNPNTKDLIYRFWQTSETDSSLCFILIQALKKNAEDHIKTQSFEFAEHCYKFAITVQENLFHKTNKLVLPPHDEALLWSNISFVKEKQKKYVEALEDALHCIELDGTYSKGYWRASRASRGLKKYAEAAFFLLKYLAFGLPNDDDFKNFMTEVAILVTYFKSLEDCGLCETENIYTTESPSVWNKILKMLCDHAEYKAIGILTIGTSGDPQVPETFIHRMAAVPKLDLSFMNVGQILKALAAKE